MRIVCAPVPVAGLLPLRLSCGAYLSWLAIGCRDAGRAVAQNAGLASRRTIATLDCHCQAKISFPLKLFLNGDGVSPCLQRVQAGVWSAWKGRGRDLAGEFEHLVKKIRSRLRVRATGNTHPGLLFYRRGGSPCFSGTEPKTICGCPRIPDGSGLRFSIPCGTKRSP
jgi:hypothetical protein